MFCVGFVLCMVFCGGMVVGGIVVRVCCAFFFSFFFFLFLLCIFICVWLCSFAWLDMICLFFFPFSFVCFYGWGMLYWYWFAFVLFFSFIVCVGWLVGWFVFLGCLFMWAVCSVGFFYFLCISFLLLYVVWFVYAYVAVGPFLHVGPCVLCCVLFFYFFSVMVDAVSYGAWVMVLFCCVCPHFFLLSVVVYGGSLSICFFVGVGFVLV